MSLPHARVGLALLFALLGACAHEGVPGTDADVIGREAVTYQGNIPCADCPGQRLTLVLFPDSTFRLRHTYLGARSGQDETVHDLGRWAHAQDDRKRLRLVGGTEALQQFAISGTGTLRMLDNEGREIRSPLNYDLKRQPLLDPVAGPMRLRGMYVYMADAATFNECLTGKRFPVLIGKDHLSLERAYLGARAAPGSPVAAVIEGRFVHHAPEPGAPVREHVVVERFDRVLPGETCAPQAHAKASLTDTYWRPVEIEGRAVAMLAGAREPHFVLSREGNRVRGFTGCNNLAGGFEQGANGFRFTQLISTRIACMPANDLEGRFLSALHATTSQRIVGDSLELRDQEGKVRMRLEARYLR
jgi:copper homeostasis protein (lipoprotein)